MSLGGLNENVNSNISKKLAALLKKHFHIESDHYYIHFIEAEGYMIGYDGATFYPFLLETNKGNATHSLLGYFKGLETRNSLRLIL